MSRVLMNVADFAAKGPFSQHSLRWMIHNANNNGLAEHGAILRIGRRVFIDPAKFDAWIDAQQKSSAPKQ